MRREDDGVGEEEGRNEGVSHSFASPHLMSNRQKKITSEHDNSYEHTELCKRLYTNV